MRAIFAAYLTILGEFAKLRKANVSFVMSVRPSVRMQQLCSTGQIFMKFDICVFFKTNVQKIKVSLNLDKNEVCCK